MAGIFTGGTTQTKNGITTKVNKSGSLPGLSSVTASGSISNKVTAPQNTGYRSPLSQGYTQKEALSMYPRGSVEQGYQMQGQPQQMPQQQPVSMNSYRNPATQGYTQKEALSMYPRGSVEQGYQGQQPRNKSFSALTSINDNIEYQNPQAQPYGYADPTRLTNLPEGVKYSPATTRSINPQGKNLTTTKGKVVDQAPTNGDGLTLSNTGNVSNIPTKMYGTITPKPGGRLNEAEVQTNAALASAYGQAAINRPNQFTPYGSSEWAVDPETGQFTNTVSLSHEQQALLDSQTKMQTGLADVGSGLVDQVREQYSTPLDFSGAPEIQNGTTVKGVNRPNLQTSIQPYGNIQNDVGYNGQIQNRVGDAGNIQRQVDTSGISPLTYSANRGAIQNQIDMSGVPSLVGGQDLLGFQNEARDAAWNNAKAALDPQWNSYETGLETKLANQGVMQGSDAWNKAISEMSRNRQYDYSQAQNNAVSQGLTAAQQLYGQGLSSNQNAYTQALGRGNFTNAAQAQDFGQNYDNATLGNQASMDMFNARRAVMSDANAAQQQQYSQNANDMSQGNAAQNQGYTQAANNMQLRNEAQQQGFGQNQANAEFGNNAGLAGYSMDYQNAELNNAGINQDFNNSMSARGQYINELMTQRNAPLSALTSIMNGTQPSMPDFNSTNAVGNINSPDTMSGLSATKQANAAQTAAKYAAAGNIISSGIKAFS